MNASDDGPGEDVRFDSETEVFSSRFDYEDPDEPVQTIVRTLAVATEQEPNAMEPLWTYVEPDALNSLFAEQGGDHDHSGRVTFMVDDWQITVYSGGKVLVDKPP
ncbi:hypothetical protein QA599_10425 [Haloarculaceae archaeon H-GB1-1]|nr:hypothetical protein [Haloarculaceae archaeon H-GB1-1]